MRPPKPALNAIYKGMDGMRYMVLEVTDLPFIGHYQLVLVTEHELRNGTEVAPITGEEFGDFCTKYGLQRITLGTQGTPARLNG
jgi:hypothetical protein